MPVKGCKLGGDEAACAQSGLLAADKGQPKVMHIVWPARAARSWSGRRLGKLKDATSVSRTTRLT